MGQTTNSDRKIPTRRISFEASLQDLPKHFAVDGDLILSHVAASLSAVFPDGEDFFVRSVRHFRERDHRPGAQAPGRRVHRPGGHARSGAPGLQRPPRSAGLPDQALRADHQVGPRHPRAIPARQVEPRRHRRPRALHRHARRAPLEQRGDPGAVRPRGGQEPLPVARARGVRAQGRRLRRLPRRRGDRAHARLDHELLPVRLRRGHDGAGRHLAARRPGHVPPREPATEPAHGPAVADHAAASSGPSCATTTDRTSTPTTATPPSSSSAGGASCSASTAPSTAS